MIRLPDDPQALVEVARLRREPLPGVCSWCWGTGWANVPDYFRPGEVIDEQCPCTYEQQEESV